MMRILLLNRGRFLRASIKEPIIEEAPSRIKDEINILTDKEKEISDLLTKCSSIR